MTYHLPRIFHWLANSSVGIYKTANVRQVQMPPLAEYGMLHLWALTGFEGVFNLQQLFALIISIVAATKLAERIGADMSGQILSGWLTVTSWPVILQATTPKNDIVVGMFLLVVVLSVFELLCLSEFVGPAIRFGLSIALGLFTKGTAYLFFAPILTIVGIALFASGKRTALKCTICSTIACCLLVNVPFWQRNWIAFGSPLVGASDYTNANFRITTTFVNLLRVGGSALATDNGVFNRAIESFVLEMPELLGVGKLDGTIYGNGEYGISGRISNEDYAPYHLHLLAFLVTLGIQCHETAPGKGKRFLLLAFVVSVGILFCSVSRWQIWITRLVIPLAMLASVWIGSVVAAGMPTRIGRTLRTEAMVALMLFTLVPVLCMNDLKRFIGHPNNVFESPRDVLLFASNPMLAEKLMPVCEELQELSDKLKRPIELAFYATEDSYEYPLWTRSRSRVSPIEDFEQLSRLQNIDAIYIDGVDKTSTILLQLEASDLWLQSPKATKLWTR